MRLYVTGIVTVCIWTLLLWNHFHGGVPRHHILANEDLPSFSNWWGGLLLPLLTRCLLYRIQMRISRQSKEDTVTSEIFKKVLTGFACALLFGILLSTFFTPGYADLCGSLMLALLPLGLFAPIYRAECLLGFVLGMTYTFGAVLPIGIGSILVLLGVVLYLFVRAALLYAFSRFAPKGSSDK